MTADEIAKVYQIRKLSKDETIVSFNCGDEDLNDFILNESLHYRQARLAVSYVIEKRSTKQVVGFFSLANDKVSVSDFENKTDFNRFLTVDAYTDAIPFYLKNRFLPLSEEEDNEHTKLLFFDLEEIEE